MCNVVQTLEHIERQMQRAPNHGSHHIVSRGAFLPPAHLSSLPLTVSPTPSLIPSLSFALPNYGVWSAGGVFFLVKHTPPEFESLFCMFSTHQSRPLQCNLLDVSKSPILPDSIAFEKRDFGEKTSKSWWDPRTRWKTNTVRGEVSENEKERWLNSCSVTCSC